MRSAVSSDRGFWKFGFLLFLLLGGLLAPAAQAQPFDSWMALAGSPNIGYVQIPHSTALNPTNAFTFEAWVNVTDPSGGCKSIAGKNWHEAWWIGICGQTLRSYVRGSSIGGRPGVPRDGGDLPPGTWTHIAVVFNGTQRLHYVNGELAASWPEAGPLTTSDDPVRIGGDVQWNPQPQGAIDEVRLWNVARTQGQIRAWLNERIRTAQPGLVAVWTLDATPADFIGPHDGTVIGTGVGVLTFSPGVCVPSGSQLCLRGRFGVTAKHRAGGAPGSRTTGNASVAVSSFESGVLSFFGAANWEVLVKVLNGCGLNNRYWVYAASTTDVFYRMEVFDYQEFENKIFFNYPGAPAPALTESDAFATCP